MCWLQDESFEISSKFPCQHPDMGVLVKLASGPEFLALVPRLSN